MSGKSVTRNITSPRRRYTKKIRELAASALQANREERMKSLVRIALCVEALGGSRHARGLLNEDGTVPLGDTK